MHSNDLEACGMKICCFWFHSDVKFLTRSLYSGERQWPAWASGFFFVFFFFLLFWKKFVTPDFSAPSYANDLKGDLKMA